MTKPNLTYRAYPGWALTLDRRAIVILSAMSFALAACAAPPPGGDAKPASTTEWGPPGDYRLQVGDEVEVKLLNTPELNEKETIRDDGMISVALIPDVPAAGSTLAQLTDRLRTTYIEHKVKSPDVKVYLRTPQGNRVTVLGEVVQQGNQILLNSTTVTQAIAQAQGFKPTAYSSEVLVIRPMPEGNRLIRTVDYPSIMDGSAVSQDVYLQPRDIVFVPMSPIARVDQFVDQYVRQVLPGSVNGSAVYQFGTVSPGSASTAAGSTAK